MSRIFRLRDTLPHGSGIHRLREPQHLHQHTNHAAWLENNRRKDTCSPAIDLVVNAMDAPVSRAWKGYRQRAA